MSQEQAVDLMATWLAQPPDRSRVSKWETGTEEPSGLGLFAYLLVLGKASLDATLEQSAVLIEIRALRHELARLLPRDTPTRDPE
jgi:hypothetical protein